MRPPPPPTPPSLCLSGVITSFHGYISRKRSSAWRGTLTSLLPPLLTAERGVVASGALSRSRSSQARSQNKNKGRRGIDVGRPPWGPRARGRTGRSPGRDKELISAPSVELAARRTSDSSPAWPSFWPSLSLGTLRLLLDLGAPPPPSHGPGVLSGRDSFVVMSHSRRSWATAPGSSRRYARLRYATLRLSLITEPVTAPPSLLTKRPTLRSLHAGPSLPRSIY